MSPIGITAQSCQSSRVILDDGSAFSFTLTFKPMQLGWFITDLTYGNFELQGVRVVVSPNILHQYKNQIPFGLACYSQNNREPSLVTDFSDKSATLYTLSAAEVAQVARLISGQAG